MALPAEWPLIRRNVSGIEEREGGRSEFRP